MCVFIYMDVKRVVFLSDFLKVCFLKGLLYKKILGVFKDLEKFGYRYC